MAYRTLDQAGELRGRRALVRVDFNVPMDKGAVADDTRLRAALPTIRFLSERGARIVLLAHFGRPKGARVAEMSLEPVAVPLSALLEQPVAFSPDCVGPEAARVVEALEPGGMAGVALVSAGIILGVLGPWGRRRAAGTQGEE